jgi:peptidylprolyl isomerase
MNLSALVASFVLASQTNLQEGNGPAAQLGDVVTINYVGRALDGQIFDSTKLTPPFAFVLGSRALIQGHARVPFAALDKAIVGMKAGQTKTIELTPQEGFGELQVGDIPPGSKLTFEVEVFEVRPKGSQAEVKIEELKPGVGEPAAEGDTIEAHYRGTFLNGRQFDTSYQRQQDDGSKADMPLTVEIGSNRLIAGFMKGLTGMRAGGKRRITIPYELAYGKDGRPPVIPAYSTLVFELDAVRVVKKPSQ